MSNKVIKDVLVRIGADSKELESALNSSLGALKSWSVAGAAAIGAATGALTAFTVSAVRSAAEIENLSKLSNASTTEFQRMAAASSLFGVEQDKLADILKDVNDKVGEFAATGSGPLIDFFEQVAPKVGVTIDQFKELSGPDALQLYVSSLEKAGLNQQQVTFYMEALASESSRLTPLLRGNGAALKAAGDEAERLGAVLSQETLQHLRSAQESLRQSQLALEGFGNQIVAAVAPALEVFAGRLSDVLTNNDQVQGAVENLAGAFGALTGSLSDPAVVEGLVKALELLVQAAGLGISVISTLASNLEIATAAAAAAAVALAALGGPITLIVGLAGAAAAGLSLIASGSDSAAGSAGAFQGAINGNAASLRGMASATREAKEELFQLINAQRAQSGAIAETLGTQLDETTAKIEELRFKMSASGQALGMGEALFPSMNRDLQELQTLEGRLAEITPRFHEAALEGQVLTAQLRAVQEALNEPAPSTPSSGEGDDSGSGTDSGPSGGGGPDPWAARLENLANQMASEREMLDQWYVESQETLRQARERELLTEEQFNTRSIALEKKYQEQRRALERAGAQQRAAAWSGALGDLAGLMQSGNKKLFEVGKKAAIAQSVIDGWSSATAAWQKGMKIGGPIVAGAFAAFSLAKTGAMIASISSQQFEGGGTGTTSVSGGSPSTGSGSSSSRGSTASGGASAPAIPETTRGTSTIMIQGDVIGKNTGEELIRSINEAQEAGHRIDIQWLPTGALG